MVWEIFGANHAQLTISCKNDGAARDPKRGSNYGSIFSVRAKKTGLGVLVLSEKGVVAINTYNFFRRCLAMANFYCKIVDSVNSSSEGISKLIHCKRCRWKFRYSDNALILSSNFMPFHQIHVLLDVFVSTELFENMSIPSPFKIYSSKMFHEILNQCIWGNKLRVLNSLNPLHFEIHFTNFRK